MKRKTLALITLLVIVAFATAACGGSGQQKTTAKVWTPDSTIEIVAPAAPGGGWDLQGRALQKAAAEEKLITKNIIVSNKPGGGGATGWNYLKSKEGNGHFVAMNSSLLLLNNLLGSSSLTYKDFTPLAMLSTEWIAIHVKADSPYKTAKDVMEALKKDPGSLTIGVGPSLGNNDHLSFIRAAQKFGVDVTKLKWIVYEGGSPLVMSLLGGHVDIGTQALSEAIGQHKAGKVRILAVTSDKRVEAIPDVPTWKEQGVDLVYPHWRGIMGPPNMTPEQIKFWDDFLSKVTKTESFKKSMENMNTEVYYKNSAETKKMLEEQNALLQPLVDQLGLKKK